MHEHLAHRSHTGARAPVVLPVHRVGEREVAGLQRLDVLDQLGAQSGRRHLAVLHLVLLMLLRRGGRRGNAECDSRGEGGESGVLAHAPAPVWDYVTDLKSPRSG